VTEELNKTIANCILENIEANIRIRKMGNANLNAQQMSALLAVYVVLSIPLYHASRSRGDHWAKIVEQRAIKNRVLYIHCR
jgi:hypothetical protein